MTPELEQWISDYACMMTNSLEESQKVEASIKKMCEAYLDEAIRVCVPERKGLNDDYEYGWDQCIDDTLSNIERFKKGELS